MIEFTKPRLPAFPFTAAEAGTIELLLSGDLGPGTEMRVSVNGEVRWRQAVADFVRTDHNWIVATPGVAVEPGDVVDFGVFTTDRAAR